MKALMLSLLLMVGLDEAFDGGAAVRTCCILLADLVHGTERNVSESVYRS